MELFPQLSWLPLSSRMSLDFFAVTLRDSGQPLLSFIDFRLEQANLFIFIFGVSPSEGGLSLKEVRENIYQFVELRKCEM